MFEIQIDEKTKAFFENIFQHLADAKLLEFVDCFKKFVAANFAGVFIEQAALSRTDFDASTLTAEAKNALSFGENRPVTLVWYVIFSSKKRASEKIRNLPLGLLLGIWVMNVIISTVTSLPPMAQKARSYNQRMEKGFFCRNWEIVENQKNIKILRKRFWRWFMCIGVIKSQTKKYLLASRKIQLFLLILSLEEIFYFYQICCVLLRLKTFTLQ